MTERPDAAEEQEEEFRAPWHFKVLIVATVVYLVYRFVEIAIWLIGRIG